MDGQAVTIELPEALVQKFWHRTDFQAIFEEFTSKHATAKTLKKKRGAKSDPAGPQGPVPLKKQKQTPAPNVTTKPAEESHGTTVIAESPLVNIKLPSGVKEQVMLVVSDKGPYIRNQTGHPAPCQ